MLPLERRITELAARIVDDVIERGECEFVEEIAGKMPSYMIAELMGIPLEDGEKLYELTEKMHTTDDSVVSPAERGMAVMQMLGYANDIRNSKLANRSRTSLPFWWSRKWTVTRSRRRSSLCSSCCS